MFVVSAALAAASQQRIVYDLALNGEKIGTREVTVRWIERGNGERRMVESYTTAKLGDQDFACRSSGTATSKSAQFTSAVKQGAVVFRVQGSELPDGTWRVLVEDGKGIDEHTVAAQLSSLDLFDPTRVRALDANAPLGLVLAESGDLVSGTLREAAPGTLEVGGATVPVTRYTLDGTGGVARFDLDSNGTLLRSELRWLGGTVVATARALPPPRSYGDVERIDGLESAVEETPL